jgi:hypothetical protein
MNENYRGFKIYFFALILSFITYCVCCAASFGIRAGRWLGEEEALEMSFDD